MKTGVLLWGFSELDIIAATIKNLNTSIGIEDFYVQIEPQQKTISLLNVFPEEILRTDYVDLSFLYQWLLRNEKKNIIVVIDFWSFFLLKDFQSIFPHLVKILKLKFKFIFLCPKVSYHSFQKNFSKKLSAIYEKTKNYSQSLRFFHEFALNNASSLFLLESSPSVPFLNSFVQQDCFLYGKSGPFVIAPNLLKNYPAIFLGLKAFSEGVSERIQEIAKNTNLPLSNTHKASAVHFYSLLNPDYLNSFYKKYPEITNKRDWSFSVPLERFYKTLPKERTKFFIWLLYLGIVEYLDSVQRPNQFAL